MKKIERRLERKLENPMIPKRPKNTMRKIKKRYCYAIKNGRMKIKNITGK
jgi:hypothetical protein